MINISINIKPETYKPPLISSDLSAQMLKYYNDLGIMPIDTTKYYNQKKNNINII